MKKKKIISMLLALTLVTGLLVASGLVNQMAGYSMAKYDLYKGKPKYYLYGLRYRADPVFMTLAELGIEAVDKGCVVGSDGYDEHMAYNKEIRKHFPQIE